MIGDHLLVEEKHRRVAAEIAERIGRGPEAKLVVAIAGESGSGKSEVAHELARALKAAGRMPKLLSLDDLYRTAPAERTPWRKEQGIEAVGEDEIDWPLVERLVAAFRDDAEATMPVVDLHNDRVDRLSTSFDGIRVLIVDGLYALRAPADLRVFLELTYRETEKAQLTRGKEAVDEFRARVLEREHEVVSAQRELADLVVDRDYRLAAP